VINMKNLYALSAITAAVLAASLVVAPASFAKGHAQGLTDDPGTNVGSETVTNSQGEGAEQGNGKTAEEAGGNLGKSGTAGRDSDARGNSGQDRGNSTDR
jgi:hypothetical protein